MQRIVTYLDKRSIFQKGKVKGNREKKGKRFNNNFKDIGIKLNELPTLRIRAKALYKYVCMSYSKYVSTQAPRIYQLRSLR